LTEQNQWIVLDIEPSRSNFNLFEASLGWPTGVSSAAGERPVPDIAWPMDKTHVRADDDGRTRGYHKSITGLVNSHFLDFGTQRSKKAIETSRDTSLLSRIHINILDVETRQVDVGFGSRLEFFLVLASVDMS